MIGMNIGNKFSTDENGTSITEFGLIAPVVCILMLGTMDIGHSYYVRSALDGAMQSAARSSALEGASTATQQELIDLRVRRTVMNLAPSAEITVNRRYYKTFSEAAKAKAEEWVDDPVDPDGVCNNGELFVDTNNNGVWDSDGGTAGQGGAQDVVIIKYNIKYPRLFPMAALIGLPEYVQLESNSILANQPYGAQSQFSAPQTLNCT